MKTFRKIHLWLAMPFGIVISIICLTGALLVIEKPVTRMLYPNFYNEALENGKVQVSESRSMVGTRHAVSENKSDRTLHAASLHSRLDKEDSNEQAKAEKPKRKRLPFFRKVMQLHRWLLNPPAKKGEKSPGKIIVGGPMNGTAIYSVDDPIVKVSNAVLVFDEKSAVLPDASACINCGRCIEKCPVGISVADVDRAMKVKNEDKKAKMLIDTGVRQCVDCACCSYVCPANRPLLQINWEAKSFLKKYAAAQKEKEGGNR